MPQEDTERAEHFVSVSLGDGQANSGQNHFDERPECTTRACERRKQLPTRKAPWGMAFDRLMDRVMWPQRLQVPVRIWEFPN